MTTIKKIIAYLATHIIARNLVLLFFVICFLLWLLVMWMGHYTHHNKAIMVPDLKGLQEEVAEPILSHNQLRYQVVDSVYSKDVPAGAIVEQIPNAGSKVKQNRIVFLTLNARSQRTVELPDFSDMSQRQVIASLHSIGIRVGQVHYVPYEYKDLVIGLTYKGESISQGMRLPVDAQVELLVGDGNGSMQEQDTTMMNESDKQWFE